MLPALWRKPILLEAFPASPRSKCTLKFQTVNPHLPRKESERERNQAVCSAKPQVQQTYFENILLVWLFNVQKLFYFAEKKMVFATALRTICLTVGVIAWGKWKE